MSNISGSLSGNLSSTLACQLDAGFDGNCDAVDPGPLTGFVYNAPSGGVQVVKVGTSPALPNLASSDFTIGMRFSRDTAAASLTQILMSFRASIGDGWVGINPSGQLLMTVFLNGAYRTVTDTSTSRLDPFQWHEIVWTRTGTTWSLYKNAVLVGSVTQPGDAAAIAGIDAFMGYADFSSIARGSIRDLRIFSSAVAPAQVWTATTNLEAYYKCDEAALSTVMIDYSGNGRDGVAPSSYPGQTRQLRPDATYDVKGLISFDGSDLVGTHPMTPVNGPIATAAGKVNAQAMDLEASSNQYFTLPSPTVPYFATTSQRLGVAFWFKAESLPAFQILWSKAGPGGTYYRLYLNANGALTLNMGATGLTSPIGTITIGQWYHICCDHDGIATAYSRIIVNGVTTNLALNSFQTNNGNQVTIGADPTPSIPADGVIDQFAVYERVFMVGEPEQLYNGGNGTPLI